MRYTSLPNLLVLILGFTALSDVFGQTAPAGEVDVAKCWSCSIASGERFVSDGKRIFVGESGGRVGAVSLEGLKIWSAELGGEISSDLLPLDNTVFLVTSAVSAGGSAQAGGTSLRALSKETGITAWTVKLPDASRHFLGTTGGNALLVISGSGVLQSIDAKTGAVNWRREIADGFAVDPLFSGDKLYLISTSKQLFTIGLEKGEIVSMVRLEHNATARAMAPEGTLLIGDDRGNVVSLDDAQKPNWRFKTGGTISAIVPVGDDLLAASHDNFVYFLTGGKGGLAWKKRLSARPQQIGTVGGEYAIVLGYDEPNATLISLSSGKVAGQIALVGGETLVTRPMTADGKILFLTSSAVRAYSLNGCSQKQIAAARR
jgi:outer membrane protein assembly factor BamB